MGYFDEQFITEKGAALLARMAAGEGNIIFTSMHTGDGEYSLSEISRITSAESLKQEKQFFPVNDVDSRGGTTRVRSVISNQEVENGYYIRELGLYARMEGENEVLFALSVCSSSPTFLPGMDHVPLELPVTNYIAYSGDGNFTLEYRSDVFATIDMVRRISTEIGEQLQNMYENANQFTLARIAELINGAPATMDTLKEIADAMATHQSVVSALDAAIGQKANQTEMDSHVNNGTIHFTSSERQQLASVVGGFGNKADAKAPLCCTTMPSDLKSNVSGNGISVDSAIGYYEFACQLSGVLNTNYVTYDSDKISAISSGYGAYKIWRSGYYYVHAKGYMTSINQGSTTTANAVDRVKRLRLYKASSNTATESQVIADTEMRAGTYEALECQTIHYFQAGSVVAPVVQMDSYGSVTIGGTWSFAFEIMPFFIM